MNAYKIELLVLDIEDIGVQNIINYLEDTKYVYPTVKKVIARDIGEWRDDHPLNKNDTCQAEYERLFSEQDKNLDL